MKRIFIWLRKAVVFLAALARFALAVKQLFL